MKIPVWKKVAGSESIWTLCAYVDSSVPNRKGGQFFISPRLLVLPESLYYMTNTKPNVSPAYGKYIFIQLKKRSYIPKSAKYILLKSNS